MISKYSLALGVAAAVALSATVPQHRISLIGEAEARTMPQHANGHDGASVRRVGPSAPSGSNFFEDWDSYVVGTNAHGQGGWKGWMNDPSAGAFIDDAQSVSPSNSINIEGASDLIHEFSGYTSGVYTITAQMYIPSGFSGDTYFIFENVYSDVDPNIISWSTQVVFHSSTGTVENYDGAANPGSMPYITDQWVELKLVVDLDADLQTFYYNGTELYSGSWTNQFPGQTVPGISNIGSIDLYAEGSTSVFYDNISIVASTPFGVDLDGSQSGSGAPGTSVPYTLTITNTGSSQDTFDISATAGAEGWPVTPSVSSVTLDAGESTTFDVDVSIPDDAIIGTVETSTVTATSQGDPGTSATATLETTAGLPDSIFSDGFEVPN